MGEPPGGGGSERRRQVDALMPSLVADLRTFVSIPSVSGEGAPPGPLFAAHDFVVDRLRAAGVDDVEDLVIEGKVAPVVIARTPAPPGAPTVLLYTTTTSSPRATRPCGRPRHSRRSSATGRSTGGAPPTPRATC